MSNPDFKLDVRPIENEPGQLVISWVLPSPVSGSGLIGELIINDNIMNESVAGNGYRSVSLTDKQLREFIHLFGADLGVEYSVTLLVRDVIANKRYVNTATSAMLKGKPQAPVISVEGIDRGIRIITDYTSVAGPANGYAKVDTYVVIVNNVYNEYVAAGQLIIERLDSARPDSARLVNDVTYEIGVRALNEIGGSEFVTKNIAPTDRPVDVPSLTATARDQAVDLVWSLPSSLALNSKYKLSKKTGTGNWSAEESFDAKYTVAAVPPTVETEGTPERTEDKLSHPYGGLSNTEIYSFRIRVYNPSTNKYSDYREVHNVRPFGVPDAPIAVVTKESGKIKIKLSKPLNENGKSVTSYILKKVENGLEKGEVTPLAGMNSLGEQNFEIVVENGTLSTFNAYALNDPLSMSGANLIMATAYGNPGKVTELGAVGGDEQVTLTWVKPAVNGGAPAALNYKVTYDYVSTPALGFRPEVVSTETVNTTDLRTTLTLHLENGQSETFKVVANYTVEGVTYSSDPEYVSCVPFKLPDAPVVTPVMDAQDNISYSWIEPNLHGLPFSKYQYQFTLDGVPTGDSWADVPSSVDEIKKLIKQPIPSSSPQSNGYGKVHKLLIRTVTMNGDVPVPGNAAEPTFITPYKPPSVVQGLEIYPRSGALEVIWNPPLDFGGYTSIKYKVGIDNDTTSLDVTSDEKIIIDDLTDRSSYNISVIALGYIGANYNNQQSAPVSKSGTPYSAPNPPTDFTAVPQDNLSVRLNWVAAAGLYPSTSKITYVVFRDDDLVHTTPEGVTSFTETKEKGRAYKYKVMTKQVWGDNYISYSAFTDLKTATPYTKPSNVSGFGVSVSDSAMQIYWSALSDAARNGLSLTETVFYEVKVSHMTTGVRPTEIFDYDQAVSGVTHVDVTGLDNDTVEYTVRVNVKIYNSEIEENVLSGVESTKVYVASKPLAPVDPEFIVGDNAITVNWFSPPASESYTFVRYEIWVNNEAKINVLTEQPSGVKNTKVLILTNGTSYVVKIQRIANDMNNRSYPSDTKTSLSLMPFGLPLITSVAIDSNDKKKLNFVINPNGSPVTQIVSLVVGSQYTEGDDSFLNVPVSKSATSVPINETISFRMARGEISSFLALVVNAKGAAVYSPQ